MRPNHHVPSFTGIGRHPNADDPKSANWAFAPNPDAAPALAVQGEAIAPITDEAPTGTPSVVVSSLNGKGHQPVQGHNTALDADATLPDVRSVTPPTEDAPKAPVSTESRVRTALSIGAGFLAVKNGVKWVGRKLEAFDDWTEARHHERRRRVLLAGGAAIALAAAAFAGSLYPTTPATPNHKAAPPPSPTPGTLRPTTSVAFPPTKGGPTLPAIPAQGGTEKVPSTETSPPAPVITYTEQQAVVTDGMGWYEKFGSLGVKTEDRAALLRVLGPDLVASGVAYARTEADGSASYGMTRTQRTIVVNGMTVVINMPLSRAMLDKIMHQAGKRGMLTAEGETLLAGPAA